VAGEEKELADLLARGRYSEAEEWRKEEPERFPLLWARLLRETGRGVDSLALLEAHPRFAASEADFLVSAAGLLQEKGELARAKELLRRAIREGDVPVPAAAEVRTRLGQVLVREGLREDGREQFTAVLELYKGLTAAEVKQLPAETFVWMGKAAEGLERFDEAYRVLYSTAFDIDANSVAAHVASGWILYAKYNYPDARSHFEDAISANPNHADAHIGLARAVYADYGYPGERFADTKLHLAEAERVWPGHPEARMLEGDIAFYDEMWEEAERSYRAAIDQDPTDLWRKGRLAALFFANARLAEFDAFRAEVERSHPAPAPFYGSLAERLVDRFFYVEAADFAHKAVEIDPLYWPAYVVLGINALRAGREEEGREWTRKALDADPFNVWAFNTLQLIKRIDRTFTEKRDEDFIIRMAEDEAPYLMPYLEPLLRETRARMERAYEEAVHRPITVEDFSEHQYFSARSIGLPGLAASGVCFGRMVTLTTPRAIPGNWGAVAVHEFAHVVTLAKAKHRIPRWFGEGLSVFEEGRAEPRWRRHYADEWVTAVHAGEILGMADIQKGFTRPTWPGQILLSYYQGGVLCSFIEAEWGYEKILAMLTAYREGKSTPDVFHDVLGVSLAEFDGRFARHARALADSFGIGPEWPERSIQRLSFHTEDHPDDAAGWLRLGFAYFFNGRQADAELSLGKAAAISPDLGDVAALRGFLAFRDDRKKTAREEFEKAIERGTTYPYRTRVALAILEADAGAAESAIALLRRAIEIHPDGVRPRFGRPNPYIQLAKLLEDGGDLDGAVATLEKLVAIDRDDFPTRKKLAEHWSAKGNWAKVIECAWDAPYIIPYDQEIHRMLGRAYFETAAYGLAKRELEVQLAGERPPIAEVFPLLAYTYWKLGEIEKAKDFANRAKSLSPEDPRVKEVLEAVGE
jgi:tetratricopeptide (TPR) repeat protein